MTRRRRCRWTKRPRVLRAAAAAHVHEHAARELRAALREERSDAVSVYLLDQATGKAPQTGLIHYILGRLLFQRGGYAESIPELRRSLELGLPDRRFVYQAELMIGQAELLLGQSAAAQATFEHLASWLLSDEADKQTEVTDFVERARHWDRLPTTG